MDELVSNEKSKALKARAKAMADKKLQEECPFKPNVNYKTASRMITNMIADSRLVIMHAFDQVLLGKLKTATMYMNMFTKGMINWSTRKTLSA